MKKPDALVVLDVRREHNAVKEAKDTLIPVVGVTDTNASPLEVNYPIVANDDSPTAIEYLINELITAYKPKTK
jgi:small subunit ribosomal protein S2